MYTLQMCLLKVAYWYRTVILTIIRKGTTEESLQNFMTVSKTTQLQCIVDDTTFDSNTCHKPSLLQHHHWCYGGGVDLEAFTAKSTGSPANNRIK